MENLDEFISLLERIKKKYKVDDLNVDGIIENIKSVKKRIFESAIDKVYFKNREGFLIVKSMYSEESKLNVTGTLIRISDNSWRGKKDIYYSIRKLEDCYFSSMIEFNQEWIEVDLNNKESCNTQMYFETLEKMKKLEV